mgnify:FL=1
MKAEKFIYNHLPQIQWIRIADWIKDDRSKRSSQLIVIAYADRDAICVTHGWSLPGEGYKKFSHCKAGRLDGGSRKIERRDIVAVAHTEGWW